MFVLSGRIFGNKSGNAGSPSLGEMEHHFFYRLTAAAVVGTADLISAQPGHAQNEQQQQKEEQ